MLHLAADRRSATAMSIPRDLMVEIPSCRRADGESTPARTAQFNDAYSYGGTACTIRTVERLTRIGVDHHMVVDFQGFKRMVDAVDGVRICLKQPMDDKDAHVRLPAGEHTLNGEQSLGFVRARKSLGNGSDTDRMERQQQFLGALVAKVQSNGVLLNPGKLYPLLDAATSSLTTDPSLSSLIDLYDLVRSMRNIPTKEVRFLTVPREAYAGTPIVTSWWSPPPANSSPCCGRTNRYGSPRARATPRAPHLRQPHGHGPGRSERLQCPLGYAGGAFDARS